MTVEIEEITEKRITWGLYKAIFRSTAPGEIELQPEVTTLQSLQVDIRKDPEGFAEFANSIWAALKFRIPPPKKPRKRHLDSESPLINTEQAIKDGILLIHQDLPIDD